MIASMFVAGVHPAATPARGAFAPLVGAAIAATASAVVIAQITFR